MNSAIALARNPYPQRPHFSDDPECDRDLDPRGDLLDPDAAGEGDEVTN